MAILCITATGVFKNSQDQKVEARIETGMVGTAQEAILFAALTRLTEVAREEGLQAVEVRNVNAALEGGDNVWPVEYIKLIKKSQKS